MGAAEEAIVSAAKVNDVARVKDLLAADPAVAATKTKDGSLVMTATFHGAREVVGLLLAHLDESALTIHEAATVGLARRIEAIVKADPGQVGVANHDGFSPLGLAAFFGHVDAAKALLAAGAPIDEPDKSVFGNTPLDAAVAGDRTEAVKVLLEAGASVNVRDPRGTTPLHKAAFNGNLEVAKLLLERGADVNARRDDRVTPLAVAVEKAHAKVAELLREHGES